MHACNGFCLQDKVSARIIVSFLSWIQIMLLHTIVILKVLCEVQTYKSGESVCNFFTKITDFNI